MLDIPVVKDFLAESPRGQEDVVKKALLSRAVLALLTPHVVQVRRRS
jgi:hypothetical protein